MIKHFARYFFFLFLIGIFFVSCYPKKKILGKYPNGKSKVVRHSKWRDSTNEKVISYYKNGKIESIYYYKNLLPPYQQKEWYESGIKKIFCYSNYKDTMTVYIPKDSIYYFTYLRRDSIIQWDEKGKIVWTEYPKYGQKIDFYYNDTTGVFLKKEIRNVRPDGYDTIRSFSHK